MQIFKQSTEKMFIQKSIHHKSLHKKQPLIVLLNHKILCVSYVMFSKLSIQFLLNRSRTISFPFQCANLCRYQLIDSTIPIINFFFFNKITARIFTAHRSYLPIQLISFLLFEYIHIIIIQKLCIFDLLIKLSKYYISGQRYTHRNDSFYHKILLEFI